MHGVLLTLSPKRLAQIEAEPETVDDVLEARDEQEIPGLLDIGNAWDAIDVLLSDRGKDPVLGDVVLGRTGEELDGTEAKSARILSPTRVAEVASKLAAISRTLVKDRYPSLAAKQPHGRLGKDPAEIEGLEVLISRVMQLYGTAARQKHGMLCIIVA